MSNPRSTKHKQTIQHNKMSTNKFKYKHDIHNLDVFSFQRTNVQSSDNNPENLFEFVVEST